MQHHKIKIAKTAHYYTHGTLTEQTQYFWLVAHGYGQLANSIIRKFEIFNTEDHFILAPEALNRFYWGDIRKGIVAANWMTKQDRLDDIEDYTNYLTQVYNLYKDQIPADAHIIFMGFSQGTATILRWILRGYPKCHHVIMWGGMLPEDIDYQEHHAYLKDKKLHFICGDADEFITPERLDWHLNFAKQQGIALNYVPFVGRHEILTDVLKHLFEKEIADTAQL